MNQDYIKPDNHQKIDEIVGSAAKWDNARKLYWQHSKEVILLEFTIQTRQK
jgi:hypothetical protein